MVAVSGDLVVFYRIPHRRSEGTYPEIRYEKFDGVPSISRKGLLILSIVHVVS